MAIILVVDDEQVVRMGAADVLDEAGHTVIEADSADAAITILESGTDIEVVFSDVRMPGTMDGVRLMHVIRRRWPPIRLILTSGTPVPGLDELPPGTRFLAKPYAHNALVDLLRLELVSAGIENSNIVCISRASLGRKKAWPTALFSFARRRDWPHHHFFDQCRSTISNAQVVELKIGFRDTLRGADQVQPQGCRGIVSFTPRLGRIRRQPDDREPIRRAKASRSARNIAKTSAQS